MTIKDHRLKLGSTPLADDGTVSALPYVLDAKSADTNLGNPEAVITAVRSRLQDGSYASVNSYENRSGQLKVWVESDTYDGLAAGEQALMAETQVEGFNTLEWTPNAALALPTVFDVVYSVLQHQFDDFAETQLRRVYLLTVVSLPFARDAVLTTVQATVGGPSPAPTVTLINDCSSITGWSGGSAVATDGYIENQQSIGVARLFYSTPFDTTTARYVWIDYSVVANVGGDNSPKVAFYQSGQPAPAADAANGVLVYQGSSDRAGFTRCIYQVPAAAASTATVMWVSVNVTTGGASQRFRIDKVQKSNTLPALGTNRQRSRSLRVGGSARARASLVITADAGQTLGDLTILYTRLAGTGLTPSLRPYRVSSSSIATDTTTISGAYNSLVTPMVFNVPANRIQEAAHDLVLRLRATTAGTYNLTWTATLASATNTDLPETTQTITGTTAVTFPNANVWQTEEVGLLQLPTVPVASDSTHMIRLTLVASGASVQLDEGWLFDLDNGALSWVATTGLTRLEVRTADTRSAEPSYWGGTADGGLATGLVRADYRVVSFADHIVKPGAVEIFTVTSGTEGSSASAMFYRAWHSNVRSTADGVYIGLPFADDAEVGVKTTGLES